MLTREEMIDTLWRLATYHGWDLDTDCLTEASLTPFPEEPEEDENDE